MKIVPTNMTVIDYCTAMDRGEIVVNRNYQRSDKVWPVTAKSYLIETVLTGYPVPKLSLYQKVDVKSKKTFKEIVDGQQRSMTLQEFLKDELVLSRSLDTAEVAGRTYSQIDSEFQQRFLEYSVSIDLFVSATSEEVVEVFRRMNSYTVPLNPEEQRHAVYQGPFKWFINRLAKRFERSFMQIGLFSKKQVVRMADNKLLTEVCHAMMYGIKTTNRKMLDHIYSERDVDFQEEREFQKRLEQAVDELASWVEVHETSLVKPYIIYSLMLAIIHVKQSVSTLSDLFTSPKRKALDRALVVRNLSVLAEALDSDDKASPYQEFVQACTQKTNVKDQREKRFRWLCRAITSEL